MIAHKTPAWSDTPSNLSVGIDDGNVRLDPQLLFNDPAKSVVCGRLPNWTTFERTVVSGTWPIAIGLTTPPDTEGGIGFFGATCFGGVLESGCFVSGLADETDACAFEGDEVLSFLLDVLVFGVRDVSAVVAGRVRILDGRLIGGVLELDALLATWL